MNPLSSQVLRFGGVGAVGFAVDGGLLFLIVEADVAPYVARLFSFGSAVLTTWLLNRNWTFLGADRRNPAAQFIRYLTSQSLGAASNYAVFAIFLFLAGSSTLNAMIGFVLGSAIGMFINFYLARRHAFRV